MFFSVPRQNGQLFEKGHPGSNKQKKQVNIHDGKVDGINYWRFIRYLDIHSWAISFCSTKIWGKQVLWYCLCNIDYRGSEGLTKAGDHSDFLLSIRIILQCSLWERIQVARGCIWCKDWKSFLAHKISAFEGISCMRPEGRLTGNMELLWRGWSCLVKLLRGIHYFKLKHAHKDLGI